MTNPNAAAIQALLLWARTERFAIHAVTIGDVSLTVSDLAEVGPKDRTPVRGEPASTRKPPPQNVYEEYGGEAWTTAVEAAGGSEVDDDPEDDEEDDPDAK